MQITLLRAKIHRATCTMADLHYQGSISIDENLLKASGILPNEQVDVLNINNGERFTTYAIIAEEGSGTIGVNGAAARKVQQGDLLIICAYGQLPIYEAKNFTPTVIILNQDNKIIQ